MREQSKTTISGTEYTATQLGALAGSRVMLRLAAAMKRAQSDDVSAEILTDAEWDYVRDQFAASTSFGLAIQTVGGAKTLKQPLADHFDEHFAGRYAAMLEWFVFCLKANFGSFLAEVGPMLSSVAAKAENASSSQKVATQPSGVS